MHMQLVGTGNARKLNKKVGTYVMIYVSVYSTVLYILVQMKLILQQHHCILVSAAHGKSSQSRNKYTIISIGILIY